MCTLVTVNPKALPFLLAAFALTVSIFFEGKLTSEAMPVTRQDSSVDAGPLYGSDFLSLFIEPSFPRRTSTEITTAEPIISTEHRITRSTLHLNSYGSNTYRRITPTVGNLFKINRPKVSSENNMRDGVVVAVRVSSSVGKTLINRQVQQLNLEPGNNDIEEHTTIKETLEWNPYKPTVNDTHKTSEAADGMSETPSSPFDSEKTQVTNLVDQIPIPSEDHPSIIAESSKTDFAIEEKEPITTNTDLGSSSSQYFPPPRLPDFNPPSDLLKHGQSQTKIHPYQQTIIFHNTGNDNQARSVSYSTVAQGVSNIQDKNWNGENFKTHERQERHYDGTKTAGHINNFGNNKDNGKYNESRSNGDSSASFPVTELPWKPQSTHSTTTKFSERNWESSELPYPPKRLLQPEENYEVDESVSVVTNGRVHGVQPKQSDSKNKKDDNQKVGYVVEGRNYRKYRVEERTSDGFIVGEYGVVSHDDGSLRGVRYTADGTINPRLIYDALMKFLSL